MAHLKKAAAKHATRPAKVEQSITSQLAPGVDPSQLIDVTYDITVFSNSGEAAHSFQHAFPPTRFATQALEGQLIGSMVQLHERGVFESKAWHCIGTVEEGKSCGNQATTFASYHISALRSTPAGARTIAFPICKSEACKRQAEQIWGLTQQQIAATSGIGTQTVDSETGELGEKVFNQGPVIDID